MDEFDRKEPQLPLRVQLYKLVSFAFNERFSETVESCAEKLEEKNRNVFLEKVASLEPENRRLEYDKSEPLAMTFASADHLSLSDISPPESTDPSFEICLELFADGSPFMFDEDLAEVGDSETDYSVVIFPEYPPFIVSTEVLNNNDKGRRNLDYLELLQQKGKSPHFLTEEDCQTICLAMRQQPVHATRTLTDSLVPGGMLGLMFAELGI